MRILVVEDEPGIGKAIKKGLMQEKYAVDLAVDGAEGLDLGSTVDYDLIILDRMLPEIDGIKLCLKLRKLKIKTPILMLTAKSQTHDKIEGLDSGADDYLTKPFSFDELLARIMALSRRPKKILVNNLSVGEISLDDKTYFATRLGKKINLSKKEYSIL